MIFYISRGARIGQEGAAAAAVKHNATDVSDTSAMVADHGQVYTPALPTKPKKAKHTTPVREDEQMQ